MAKRVAFLFPGQGSQFVGMGKEWFEGSALAREIFQKADAMVGRPLSKTCFEGPEEDLKRTENTQPGLYLCGVVGAALLAEAGVRAEATAGHSLGEYSALAAAGVFTWEDGLKLVQARGAAMNAAAESAKGTMAAILGLEEPQVVEACQKAQSAGVVGPANFNGPGQIVISGDVKGVEAAVEACKALGARRALLLPVHGAFHSPLMEPAVSKMRAALAGAKLSAPGVKFLANVTGDFMSDPEAIREGLAAQITSCVRWTDIMSKLIASGVDLFIEVGPGKVLGGIAKRMGKDIPCLSCSTPGDVAAAAQAAAN